MTKHHQNLLNATYLVLLHTYSDYSHGSFTIDTFTVFLFHVATKISFLCYFTEGKGEGSPCNNNWLVLDRLLLVSGLYGRSFFLYTHIKH